MDIHKPKAAHSLGEFAIEIGTIICGILIALSLEQAVELVHNRQELTEAREAITRELSFDLTSLQTSAAQDACIDKRLDLLEAWADGKTHINSAHLAAMDNRPLLRNLRATAWDITKTGAVAAHMPVDDRLAYADVYEMIANQKDINTAQRTAWGAFGRYAGKTRLTPDEGRRLKEDVGAARAAASGFRFNAPGLQDKLIHLGAIPGKVTYPAGRSATDLCEPPK